MVVAEDRSHAALSLLYRVELGPYRADEFVLESFRGEEAVSTLFDFALVLGTDLDIDDVHAELLGAPARLSIQPTPDADARVVAGIVAAVEVADESVSRERHRVHVRVVPRAWLLSQRINSRIYQDMTVCDIVESVLAELDVQCEWHVARRLAPRKYCVQYEESDLDFVQRLLAEEGIFYHLAPPPPEASASDGPEPAPEVFCFSDVAEYYSPIAGDPVLPFEPVDQGVSARDGVVHFARRTALRGNAVALSGYNFRHASARLRGRSRDSDGPAAVTPGALERYDHHSEHEDPDASPARARRVLAQDRVEAQLARGTSRCPRLALARWFDLEDHPDPGLNGRYVPRRIVHRGHQRSQLAALDGAALRAELAGLGAASEPNYENDFEALPGATAALPAFVARRMRQVVEVARVVGPAGEEIYTDPHGRIKVQFPWDRQGQMNERSSCWLRVAHAWAGEGWGAQFVPRIGMEVLVTFLGGDQDLPVVVGCLYNSDNPTPFALPEHKTQSGIRTRSSPGGQGFNELRFEDAAREEQVFLRAQRNFDELVLNDHTRTVLGHEHVEVTKNRTRTVHGNERDTVVKNRVSDIHGDHTRTVQGNEVVTIQKNFVLHIVGNQLITVDGQPAGGAAPEDDSERANARPPARDDSTPQGNGTGPGANPADAVAPRAPAAPSPAMPASPLAPPATPAGVPALAATTPTAPGRAPAVLAGADPLSAVPGYAPFEDPAGDAAILEQFADGAADGVGGNSANWTHGTEGATGTLSNGLLDAGRTIGGRLPGGGGGDGGGASMPPGSRLVVTGQGLIDCSDVLTLRSGVKIVLSAPEIEIQGASKVTLGSALITMTAPKVKIDAPEIQHNGVIRHN